MEKITISNVEESIKNFLNDQLIRKLEPEQKRLEKAEAANDTEKIAEINAEIKKSQQKYRTDTWLSDAANRMASQLKFGTHISKGIHPDSKGDNVNFSATEALPNGLVASQTVKVLELDANGNAGALPLAAFFNILVNATREIKLRDLIQADHPALSGVFSSDPGKSDEYQALFKTALLNPLSTPSTHERNKQLLWPQSKAGDTDNYICLVPLFPSSFTHALYSRINEARYSDANKDARDNRKKKNAEQSPYVSINDIAVTILGGSNSQNVSKLIAGKSGRNYLLPSLPPQISQQTEFSVSKQHASIFNTSLRYHCYFGLQELFSVIAAPKSTITEREQREMALDMILGQLLGIAARIQNSKQAGWSKDYKLNMAEKYWLDPGRSELEGEEAFAQQRSISNWVNQIEHSFSLWLNRLLKEQFKKQRYSFNDTEHVEWSKSMREAIKASQRAGEGVFA